MGLFVNPVTFQNDEKGRAASYSTYDFYESGTAVRLSTYSDAALTVPNPNPIEADKAGRFPQIFLDSTRQYRVVYSERATKNSPAVAVWTKDEVASGLDVTSGILSVASVADLPTTVIAGQTIDVNGYHPGTTFGGSNVVGGFGRHNGVTLFDPLRSAEIGTSAYYVDSGVDADCWIRAGVEYVTPEMAGSVGVIDEQTLLQAALNVSENKEFICDGSKSYRSDGDLRMPVGCKLNGNGATLDFYAQSNGECLVTNNYTEVSNIRVTNLSAATGGDGLYQVPINVSDIRAATGQGTHDVIIENVTVYQAFNTHACIGIWSDSYNIALKNITIESTTATALGILVHWGVEDDNLANGTNHGYNITIENVKCDGMKPVSKPSEGGVVFLSGCYNVSVTNVESTNNWWSVRVQPGSVGSSNCLTDQKEKILTGINVENIQSYDVFQPLSATWLGNAGANTFYHKTGITFKSCKNINTSLNTVDEISAYNVSALGGVTVIGGESKNFYHGFVGSTFGGTGGVFSTLIEGHKFDSMAHSGIIFDGEPTDLSKDNNITRCEFYRMNIADSTSSPRYSSAIYINSERTNVKNCVFGETTNELANYSVYYDVNARFGLVSNINSIGVKPTGTVVFSNSADNKLGDNIVNRSTATLANGTGRSTKCAASVTLGANQSIPNNASTQLQFSTTTINEDGCFDTATYRYTPIIPGVYSITLSFLLRAVATQTLVRGEIWRNGTLYQTAEVTTHTPSSSSNVGGCGTVLVPMNGVTDYIELYLFHNAGSAKDADGAAKTGCHADIRLL